MLTSKFRSVLRATTAYTIATFQLPKVLRTRLKNGPSMRCFAHFDLEMCFVLQPRAIFHLSSGQMAPHPSHKSLKKHCDSRLFYLFPHLHLLSSDSFSSLIFSLDCKPLPKPLLLYFGKIIFPYHFPSTSHIFPCYVALFC